MSYEDFLLSDKTDSRFVVEKSDWDRPFSDVLIEILWYEM